MCRNEGKLHENIYLNEEENIDELDYSYNEGGGFQTGPLFGCVHFQSSRMNGDQKPHVPQKRIVWTGENLKEIQDFCSLNGENLFSIEVLKDGSLSVEGNFSTHIINKGNSFSYSIDGFKHERKKLSFF